MPTYDLKNTKEISFEKDLEQNKKFYRRKCGIVIGHTKDHGARFPIAYVHKPKMISEKDFNEFLEAMQIYFVSKYDT